MHVGLVFGATTLLTPAERGAVALALWHPTRLYPWGADEIARCPLPLTNVGWFRLRQALAPAIARLVVGALDGQICAEVVPGIASLGARLETSPDVTQRLLAPARAHGCARWNDLAGRGIAEIRQWAGVGPASAARLLVAAMEVAWGATIAPSGLASPGVGAPLARPRAPSNVEPHAPTLFGLLTEPCAANDEAKAPTLPTALAECLAQISDVRQRIAFEVDELRLDIPRGWRTGQKSVTAELLGLSYARSRQLRLAGAATVDRAVATNDGIGEWIAGLAGGLGDLVDQAHLDAALVNVGVDEATRSPVGLLAVHLAGPYRAVDEHPGWWSTRPAEIVSETTALLRDGGGVHDRATLIDDISRLGVNPAVAERWLGRQAARVVGDAVVSTHGPVSDIAIRVLEASGQAMPMADLAAWMPTAEAAATIPAVLRRHRAFVRTGPDRWELADWGATPSTQLVRLEVPVTDSVVGGQAGDAPVELAAVVGLRPGGGTTISTRFGPLPLRFDDGRVQRGSVRPLVLASGARIGDVLIIVFDPDGAVAAVEVERHDPTLW